MAQRICFCIPLPPPYGGIANWSKLMLANLDLSIIDATVINTAPNARVTEGRRTMGRIVFGTLGMIRCGSALLRTIREKRPDVIHITTSGQFSLVRDWLFLRIAKRKKIPTLYHIRIGRLQAICQQKGLEYRLFMRTLCAATRVITIDQTSLQTIHATLPQVDAVYIPNPVSFRDLPTPCADERKEVLFIGWVVPAKGIEELLGVWAQIGADFPDWSLGLVGPYNLAYHADLTERYALQGVTFYGEKSHDEAIERLSHAAMLVLPSHTEGFPNVVVEAMALEKPVIATSVGAIPDMLASRCGCVIAPKQPAELKEALRTLLRDPALRKEYAQNARQKALTEYALDVVMARYIKEWRSVK